jgi:hypothetical protein
MRRPNRCGRAGSRAASGASQVGPRAPDGPPGRRPAALGHRQGRRPPENEVMNRGRRFRDGPRTEGSRTPDAGRARRLGEALVGRPRPARPVRGAREGRRAGAALAHDRGRRTAGRCSTRSRNGQPAPWSLVPSGPPARPARRSSIRFEIHSDRGAVKRVGDQEQSRGSDRSEQVGFNPVRCVEPNHAGFGRSNARRG